VLRDLQAFIQRSFQPKDECFGLILPVFLKESEEDAKDSSMP